MTETKEIKPKTFRVYDETQSKIKEITKELGGNQQQAFSKLLEAYEFQKGKVILADRKKDVEDFENYVTILTRMYMGSLEENQNVTETVRAEFDAMLKSKDNTIIELQGKLKALNDKVEEYKVEAKEVTNSNQTYMNNCSVLEKELDEKITNYESIIADKDKLNQALSESYTELKARVDKMAAEQEQLELIKEENKGLVKSYTELKEALKVDKMGHEKALLERDKEYNKSLQEIEKQHKEEIDKYQAKYLELLEKLQEQPKQRRKATQKSIENSTK